ncbi:MAG TPA: hypothetical protein VF219_03075 [Vicinamibacterales bacterium]
MNIRMAVLLSLIATVARAVVLGPEVRVAPPVLAEANGAQFNAVMASAGGDSLAAWFDQERAGLYVTTIGADGTVASPARRVYSGGASGISLCWTGATYLVTWYDYPAGLLAMPLARDGAPTRAARLVAPAQTLTHSGALAWNGRSAFLAYYIFPGHSAAILLDEQANVIRTNIALPDTPSQQSVVVAVGSTFHLFVRTTQQVPVTPAVNRPEDTITVLRFSGDGTPIDASGTVVSHTDLLANSWGVSSDGNRFALVMVELQWQSTPVLRRFLIDPQTLASQPLPAIGVVAPSGAVVTWNGSEFIAVWADYGDSSSSTVMTLPFNGGADVQPGAILTEQGDATDAIVTFNGRSVVAAWLDRGSESLISDVSGVLLDPTATRTAGARFTISTGNQWQLSPTLAPSLAVWVETEGDNSNDVFAAHATGAGFGPRVRVSTSSQAMASPAAVAFTGDTYLVVWQESATKIMARRLRPDGTALDDQPKLVADRGLDASVAFNGSTILLAYVDSDLGGVKCIRFDRAGNRIDSTPFVLPGGDNAHGTSVASDGTDFLIVWRRDPPNFFFYDYPPASQPPPPPTPDILGARVTATGTVLDTPLPLKIVASADYTGFPVVAWSGADYLVASITKNGRPESRRAAGAA